jgi:putative flippase GtrA
MIKLDALFFKHLIKYGIVGAGNAIFTFFIYFLLLKIFKIHYLISFSISWLAGVLLTYMINFVWVFKPEDKLVFKSRLAKYIVVYVTSYLLNMILLRILTEATQWDPLLTQLMIVPVIVAINFFGIKYWSMKPPQENH